MENLKWLKTCNNMLKWVLISSSVSCELNIIWCMIQNKRRQMIMKGVCLLHDTAFSHTAKLSIQMGHCDLSAHKVLIWYLQIFIFSPLWNHLWVEKGFWCWGPECHQTMCQRDGGRLLSMKVQENSFLDLQSALKRDDCWKIVFVLIQNENP